MSAFYDQASLVVVPSGYKSGKIYAQKPLTTDGQLTFTRASTATRVNASGLIETVSSGVPRLDYTNSSCPKLLLEPQRTNDCLYSQDFSNAIWYKGGATVAANDTTAPDGTNTADKVVFGAANNTIYQNFNYGGATVTRSVWVKGTAGETIGIDDGVVSQPNVTLTGQWQRISFTAAAPNNYGFGISSYNSATARTIWLWGAQVEAGAYMTSYIPTTSAAVTRLADAASKTGISSLIGQTEGTVFVDWTTSGSITSAGSYFTFLVSGTTGNLFYVALYGDGRAQSAIFVGNTIQANIITATGYITGANNKLAFAYKNNDFAFYVNGIQIGTDTSGSVPATTDINLADTSGGSMKYNQALLFKTRLTNAQLAELTTL